MISFVGKLLCDQRMIRTTPTETVLYQIANNANMLDFAILLENRRHLEFLFLELRWKLFLVSARVTVSFELILKRFFAPSVARVLF